MRAPTPATRYDVVVVGAGLGGVVAAARAAQLGARVAVVEERPVVGGTALYSGGGVHIFGATTWREYRTHCPQADPVLARRLFDGFVPFVEWAVATEAPGRYRTTTLRGHTNAKYQLGKSMAPHHRIAWFRYMVGFIRKLGGEVFTGMRATGLLRESGRIAGIAARRDGAPVRLRSDQVVLAAGGFQSDAAMLDEHVGGGGMEFASRAVEQNVGDGLRMALSAGGTTTEDMGTVYGHLMPAAPCECDWSDVLQPLLLTAFYAEHALVVNSFGERFVDEGAGELSGLTVNAAARQPGGALWIVMDRRIRGRFARYELPREVLSPWNLRYARLLRYVGIRWSGGHPSLTIDSLRFARHRGAVCVSAPTLEQLASRLASYGMHADRLVETVREFNRAVHAGGASRLAVPRTRSAHPVEDGPFLAVKVVPGVSMTYGGVRIDRDARVIGGDGAPLIGLYAVPGTAGGIHRLHYAGALAACAVFGKIAAEQAAGATV